LIYGGPFVQVPARENISAQSNFRITEHWSASWGTVYDAVTHQFASQVVTLQRDLHDWTASFSFTSNPNGNFFFGFYIANKAQPELRFPYNRSTYRQTSVP
jgi:putative heme iron utilization protein